MGSGRVLPHGTAIQGAGVVRINTRPRHGNARRPAEKSATGFLQWLRGRPCFIEWNGDCEGKMEAAHVDHAGGKGMGTKVADRHAIPLCAGHHRSQHAKGWRPFEDAFEFDAVKVAAKYWQAWPGRVAWESRNA